MIVNLEYVKESIAGLLIEGEEALILTESPYTFSVGPVYQDRSLDLSDELCKITINLTGADSTFGRNIRKNEANPVIRFICAALSQEVPGHMSHWLTLVFGSTNLNYYPSMPNQTFIFVRPRSYSETYWNKEFNYFFNYLDVEFRVKCYGSCSNF